MVAGQDFLSFQWDGLLLETGLLALLWAPPGWRPSRQEPPASAPVRWLLVFLLFKLMFLSGATKLLSGDPTWRHLTALDYHFETQPLPTWPGWYAHQFPGWTHRLGTAGMFVVELGAPWLLFAPSRFRSLRYAGVAALVLLQAGIALTGNYGFFNLLAIVLCIPALDDRVLGRVAPARFTAAGGESRGLAGSADGDRARDRARERAERLGRNCVHAARRPRPDAASRLGLDGPGRGSRRFGRSTGTASSG